MIRRPPRSTQSRSSAASDVYKRQGLVGKEDGVNMVGSESVDCQLEHQRRVQSTGKGDARLCEPTRVQLFLDEAFEIVLDKCVVEGQGIHRHEFLLVSRAWRTISRSSSRRMGSW